MEIVSGIESVVMVAMSMSLECDWSEDWSSCVSLESLKGMKV